MSSGGRMVGLSVDVDTIASHLAGYGIEAPPGPAGDGEPSWALAVRRAVDLFDRLGAKATFFLIAEAAREQPAIPRLILERGHEVGCHSMTHPLPFLLTDAGARRREIAESKLLLENLCGAEVQGFRAPSWDIHEGLLESLKDAGYRYDASSFPSWMLILLRRRVAKLSGNGVTRLDVPWGRCFADTPLPHAMRLASGTMIEIPVCTVPLLRIPFYHTLRFLLPASAFALIRHLTGRRRGALNYIFHAVDFLGGTEDAVDPRLSMHPGMRLALGEKLKIAETSVRELQAWGPVVRLDAIAKSVGSV